MNQGPRRISLMEKKEGQKSRGTIPLREEAYLQNITSRGRKLEFDATSWTNT
jgi:hypothetical protein